MKGRKPEPVQMHLLKGTFRGDRHDDKRPEPSGNAPERPAFLLGTARKEWERVVPALEKLGILDEVDQAALGVYCQARADYSWAVYKLRRDGRLYTNPDTHVQHVHPALRIQKEASEVIRKFAAEFGLTPSSRGRIVAPERDSSDPENDEWFS